jgi:hypothetical protein
MSGSTWTLLGRTITLESADDWTLISDPSDGVRLKSSPRASLAKSLGTGTVRPSIRPEEIET